MGAMKEHFMDFMAQIEEAEANDDQVTANLLHSIVALKNVISRLRLARDHYTSENSAIRDAIEHEMKTIENDVLFLEKIVKILIEQDQEAA